LEDLSKRKPHKEPAPTYGNWKKFLNINNDRPSSIHVPKQKIVENSQTSRTILHNPKKEKKIVQRQESFANLRSSAQGSISNLLAATPEYEPVKRPTRITEGSDIFKADKNVKYKGIKIFKNTSFTDSPPEENYNKSISKQMKLQDQKSSIFEKPKRSSSTMNLNGRKYQNKSNIMF